MMNSLSDESLGETSPQSKWSTFEIRNDNLPKWQIHEIGTAKMADS
jgi:hypothetical protein